MQLNVFICYNCTEWRSYKAYRIICFQSIQNDIFASLNHIKHTKLWKFFVTRNNHTGWCVGFVNPIALRKAKIVYSFGLSVCNRVNKVSRHQPSSLDEVQHFQDSYIVFLKVYGYVSRGSNSAISIFTSFLNLGQLFHKRICSLSSILSLHVMNKKKFSLTLLHSEWPKLHRVLAGVLAILIAVGLNIFNCIYTMGLDIIVTTLGSSRHKLKAK